MEEEPKEVWIWWRTDKGAVWSTTKDFPGAIRYVLPDDQIRDLVGSFLVWTYKRSADLNKRLGPKLNIHFWQYVDLLRAALEKQDD